jgi:hypothetical protein
MEAEPLKWQRLSPLVKTPGFLAGRLLPPARSASVGSDSSASERVWFSDQECAGYCIAGDA